MVWVKLGTNDRVQIPEMKIFIEIINLIENISNGCGHTNGKWFYLCIVTLYKLIHIVKHLNI